VAAALAITLSAGGCAQASAPDAPVSHEVPPSSVAPGPPQPTVVVPRAGMANVRAQPFEAAGPSADGRSLRVTFWGGVAPCFVVDRVEVRESRDAVTVTIYAGSDPASPDVACIEIALLMAIDVTLASPLGGRSIVDGAAGSTKSGAP
jgi:hypothetical protein